MEGQKMISIGLTTWSEHASLVQHPDPTLYEYAAYFPLVEVDSPYYGLPSQQAVKKWVQATPASFRFLIKANQSLTLQADRQKKMNDQELAENIRQYIEIMAPVIQAKKLNAFLLQFPASFHCTRTNVNYLRKLRNFFGQLPLVIEFRSGTWYDKKYVPHLLNFMKDEGMILACVDEPQVPLNSIPFLPTVTNDSLALIRLHGRNLQGWLEQGSDWRKKRTLYSYSEKELFELAEIIKKLADQVKEVAVVFNNNSGGDAADNALRLQKILGIDYQNLNPKQLDLF